MSSEDKKYISLGVNIDHVATLRNARGGSDPSLLEMAFEAQSGGADSITVHLREDRRHIKDEDIFELKKHLKIPINFEMAITNEMVEIALKLNPESVCIVPEKREEVTTEGGLDVSRVYKQLQINISKFKKQNIEVYLFLEPVEDDIRQAAELECSGIEIHTGRYADFFLKENLFEAEYNRIVDAAFWANKLGLKVHAGHGLNYHNVNKILNTPFLSELNIGHSIVSRALKHGMQNSVRQMKDILYENHNKDYQF